MGVILEPNFGGRAFNGVSRCLAYMACCDGIKAAVYPIAAARSVLGRWPHYHDTFAFAGDARCQRTS